MRTLCQELAHLEIESVVTAPGVESRQYEVDGQRVVRYQTGEHVKLHDLYGEGDAVATANAALVLEAESPDIVHFHAYTSGVSLRLAREVKRRGIPLIQTYHTPTVSCLRGTLLYLGREICDGVVEPRRCAECLLEAKGVPLWARRVVVAASGLIPLGERQGAAWTAMRIPELARHRSACFQELMRRVDRVVAVCDWAAELLKRNGVDPTKIIVSRQGTQLATSSHPLSGHREGRDVRLVFMGRLDETKGLHTVLSALEGLPADNISLDIYGVAQGSTPYVERIRRMATADNRIRLRPPVAPGEIVSTIANYEALVVPSVWLETGPLVVYEAFAAGVPVIGSRLGGIAELVTHERDGLLVRAEDAPAWRAVFAGIASDKSILAKLREGIRPPRTMAEVAADMSQLYRQVLESVAA